tara:strand:+ start:650 stop:1012 length:363 start_codon:yes stop_codon:yes gene_type:complete
MAFKRHDLCDLVRGDDWAIQLTIKDENDAVIDITNNVYWMTLKNAQGDADPGVIQTNITATGADAAAGIVTISFLDVNTRLVEPGRYYYDVQEVDTDNNVYTLLLGKVKVLQDVTISITE